MTTSTHDTTRIDDTRISAVRPLLTPALLQESLPISDVALERVEQQRRAIGDVLHGRDDRLIVVVGPCSIHDHDQAIEYAQRLLPLAKELEGELLVVMRVYFEKPRTTVGWKGYINDPHLDGTFAINLGLEKARRLLLDVVELGLPAGTEFLDLLSPQFISDLIAWGAIGAGTTESQTHREMASGLSMPVGFKNGTDGSALVAVQAMQSAHSPHTFLGIDRRGATAVIHTRGNPDAHLVLRGGKHPNYDPASIRGCEQLLEGAGLPARILVDCSHAQTEKDYRRQPAVLADLVAQRAAGNRSLMGFMLESHLHAGRQDLGPDLAYGVSITDGCIDWDTTERCLLAAAGSGCN